LSTPSPSPEPNHTTLAGHVFEHDVVFASAFDALGSIDANTGAPNLGWDLDRFLVDPSHAAMLMLAVLRHGGLGKGGLNFDAKVRRESTALEDMFIAHISGMDALAKGLRCAAAILEEGELEALLEQRYKSWEEEELARRVEAGGPAAVTGGRGEGEGGGRGVEAVTPPCGVTFSEMDAFTRARAASSLGHTSGKQELFEALVARHL
jgi:hypothetical protein